ncbi:MAG TPA: type II secretion system F family protein [Solirubrobacteraceae bacterium]
MSRAVLLAAAAGGAGVLAAWEVLGALEGAGAAMRRALAPLARAGRSGVAPSVAERRRVAALLAGALLAAGWLVAGVVPAALLAAGGPMSARAVVAARRRRWRADLVAGAPLVARALADALSGGHSVRGAIAEAAANGGVSGAAGAELAFAAHRLALGERTETALEALRDRAHAPAYDAVVAAILLQRSAGGDLARLLRELASSLEHAARAAADARALTAQARFTGALVALLPAGAAALAELGRPGFLADVLAFPPSAAMLAAAVLLQAVGFVAMHRLARLEP